MKQSLIHTMLNFLRDGRYLMMLIGKTLVNHLSVSSSKIKTALTLSI